MTCICEHCGERAIRPGARFCPACGEPLPVEEDGTVDHGRETGLLAEDGASELDAEQQEQSQAVFPRLIIREPGESPWEVTLDRDSFTIGRRSDNDVVLSPNYISGHHGLLEHRGDAWHYVDLGSTNGTFVNGQKMDSAVLRDGDILRIGDLQGNSTGLTFRAAGQVGIPAATAGTIRVGATDLEMKTSVTIGRNPQADIPLSAPIVSWQHARLDLTAQGHVLTDLGSTNGTFVNGQRLTQPCLLEQDDVVQIGPFTLIYEATGLQQYAVTAGVRLDGIHLSRDIGRGKRRRRILKDISMSVYPREFVAVVGTSGAGKSTLVMALNGFARATEGQVLVNGDDLYSQFDLYRSMVGYVPQDDIIHENLTVESALRYAAKLRLPLDMTDQEIERRIDRVLEQVEMVGQQNQLVSSLSGGQRKRVSIAVELLAEPNLFFLDEPTSGLDPGLEKKMMHTLRRLADGGRTVLLVTHATANIVQCDHVCFLSQGRMVYFGPPEEALGFFGVKSGDFADIYARLDDADPKLAQEKAVLAEETFRASPQYQTYVAERQGELSEVQQRAESASARPQAKVSILRQFFVLTRRYLDLVMRDRLLLTVLMAVMPIIGGLVLLVSQADWLLGKATFSEIKHMLQAELINSGKRIAIYDVVSDTQILLFIMTLASVLLGLFAAVYEIVKEWSIYQRERMVSLRILPYIASKVVVLGGFALFQCLLLMVVIGLKVGYPTQGVWIAAPIEMYITLVLATLAAIFMGLLISAIVPNLNTVIYIVFLVLFFQLVFAGVLFDLRGITDEASNLTLTRWSMEGLGSSVDMESLKKDTAFRFVTGPMVDRVGVEIETLADGWEPVTVVTGTEMVEVGLQPDPEQPVITQTVSVSVPRAVPNEVMTVTKTVTKTVSIDPGPLTIRNEEQEFRINYDPTPGHLFKTWGILIGFCVVFNLAIALVLRHKDVQ